MSRVRDAGRPGNAGTRVSPGFPGHIPRISRGQRSIHVSNTWFELTHRANDTRRVHRRHRARGTGCQGARHTRDIPGNPSPPSPDLPGPGVDLWSGGNRVWTVARVPETRSIPGPRVNVCIPWLRAPASRPLGLAVTSHQYPGLQALWLLAVVSWARLRALVRNCVAGCVSPCGSPGPLGWLGRSVCGSVCGGSVLCPGLVTIWVKTGFSCIRVPGRPDSRAPHIPGHGAPGAQPRHSSTHRLPRPLTSLPLPPP